MKGTVYSGIAFLPDHPSADLHGQVRMVIRTSDLVVSVRKKLEHLNISPALSPHFGIWQVSKSHVEEQASERRYGEILVCPVALQYLHVENYQPLTRAFIEKRRRKTA